MSTAALVIGIVTFILSLAIWFPCLGWTSWFLWIVPVIGIVLGGIGIGADNKAGRGSGLAVAGLVMSVLAFIIISIRAIVSIFTLGI